MCVKIFNVIFLLVVFVNNSLAKNDEEYVDSVINMLLNGDSFEDEETPDGRKEQGIALIGGVWKCGNCDNLDHLKLVYSEVNDLEAEVAEDQQVYMQISLSIPSMSCVAVVGDRAGVVRSVTGACTGQYVSLSVAASNHFTVNVYAEDV